MPSLRARRSGFTLIELMIVIGIIALILAIAIPNLLSARKSANETQAIAALKTFATSESVFREADRENDGNLDYGMMTELSNVTLIDSILGKGTKAGYYFSCTYSFSSSEFLWFAVSNPALPLSTGDRYFETSSGGVIFYTTNFLVTLDTSTCTLPTNGATPVGK